MPALGERRWEDAWRGGCYCAALHPNLAGCQAADATSPASTERKTWGASGAVSAHRAPRAEPGQVEGWRGGGGLLRNSGRFCVLPLLTSSSPWERAVKEVQACLGHLAVCTCQSCQGFSRSHVQVSDLGQGCPGRSGQACSQIEPRGELGTAASRCLRPHRTLPVLAALECRRRGKP